VCRQAFDGFLVVLAAALTACGGCQQQGTTIIRVDGSSTVFPITEAVAEDFQKTNQGVRVTVISRVTQLNYPDRVRVPIWRIQPRPDSAAPKGPIPFSTCPVSRPLEGTNGIMQNLTMRGSTNGAERRVAEVCAAPSGSPRSFSR
jgi:hypothetical protein